MSKYINPLTDWGFKRLFGQEFSKDLLIDFLNDLYDKESKDAFSDKLRFIYLRIPLFDKKTEAECVTNFDYWIYVLKYMEVLTRMPFTAQKKIFKRLAELADSRSLSKEEQEKYDESRKAADDYNSGLAGSYMAGEKTGIKKGIKKGIEKGIAQNKIETAKRLLDMGLTPEQVAQGTELPLDEVLKLMQLN